jgi:Tfp pilus assembly protein PilF
MLDCQLYGLGNPGMHHLTNVLLHLINTLLLFWVLKQMTGALWQSTFVAAGFALHPLHVESVAWISERKDVLSTTFWILTMIAYLRYAKNSKKGWYLLTVFVFILGLMSKPMVVTLPFVLLLLDYWPLDRFTNNKKTIILEKIPFLILSAASCVLTFVVQHLSGAVPKTDILPVGMRISNALVSYTRYIAKMLWPVKLSIFYPYPVDNNLYLQAAGSVIFLIAVSVLIIFLARKYKYLAVGWLWYLGTLVPVIGFVQVGSQSMADRYTYIPLIGLFVMFAWLVPDLLVRLRYKKTFLMVSSIMLLFLLSAYSWIQTSHWRNSVSVFSHALKITGDNSLIYNNLGTAYKSEGNLDEAVSYYRKALQITPDYANAHNNLGIVLSEQGKLSEAITHYNKALQIEPENAEAYYNLGLVYKSQGDIGKSIDCFQKALQIDPYYTGAHINLGIAMAMQGQLSKSINHFQKAVELAPDNAKAHYNFGLALHSQGEIDRAITHFKKAVQLEPNYIQARQALEMLTGAVK